MWSSANAARNDAREAAAGSGLARDPRRGRAGDAIALAVGDVEVGEPLELGQRLDALGADGGVDVTRVAHEGADQRRLGRVGVDAGGQGAVELDDVRLQAHHVGEAGVAGARVVDRQPRAAPAQVRERLVDRRVAGTSSFSVISITSRPGARAARHDLGRASEDG